MSDIRIKAVLDDKVSSGLDKIRDKFDTLGGKGSTASLFGNVGAKAIASGFGLIDRAGSAVVDMLGDATQAALEDQVSVQKLKTALGDAIPAFNGNTDAIEKTIKARMALGFADETQREGLATLVAVTHDSAKALDLEAGAMDIARARGVDLATASDAVAKAASGNSKALKSLIPGLKLGATSAETLANAFGMVAGQAQDYANTDAGKLEAAQLKINEAMEKIGYRILPAVAFAVGTLADAIDGLVSKFDDLANATTGPGGAGDGVDDLGTKIKNLLYNLGALPAPFGQVYKFLSDQIPEATDLAGKAADDLSSSFMTLASKAYSSTGDTASDVDAMTKSMIDDIDTLKRQFFDPLDARFDLSDRRADLSAGFHERAAAKTRKAYREAQEHISASLQSETTDLETLAKAGKLKSSDLSHYAHDIKTAYGKIPPVFQDIIDDMRTINAGNSVSVDISIGQHKGKQKRAGGGPVDPYEAYTIGEKGPETLVMGSQGGMIIPNGAGGGTVINFNYSPMYSTASPAEAQRFARAATPELIRELRRQGVAA